MRQPGVAWHAAGMTHLPTILDLGGDAWTLERTGSADRVAAVVPGCTFTDLQRAGRIPDPFVGRNEEALHWLDDTAWTYRRAFEVASDLHTHDQVELVCEGLDTVGTVLVNGREVGRFENMHRVWRFAVREALRPGSNELEFRFDDPTAWALARIADHRIDDGAAFLGSLLRKQHSSMSWDWAPCLAPAGIHRPIRLEGRSTPRLTWVRVEQHHAGGAVALSVTPEQDCAGGTLRARLSLAGQEVAAGSGAQMRLHVAAPQLWWPNGHGAQPLYDLVVELLVDGEVADTWRRRIGLRTIAIGRPKDAWGEAFQIVVNGRAIFMTGANWIPPHQFASAVEPATYARLVRDAADAHMTMLRVWGGGLYEQDCFYDQCDAHGILVWHDFMFSCSLYPGKAWFTDNVAAEAEHQVKRLAAHPCMALWCGNNEIEHFIEHIRKSPERERAFLALFFELLPRTVERWSPQVPYWPGSPHNPKGWDAGPSVETGGDGHAYWEPNGHRVPGLGTDKTFRFLSEFGLQAFPSMASIASFAAPEERNLFHPVIEAHQKRPGFNALLLKLSGERYRMGKDFAAQAHLTQLNQAHLLSLATEHHRRQRGRCMGTLYWQLNDTWPGITWSTVDFTGRWKAGHYAVKRSFAPVIVSPKLIVREQAHLHSRRTLHDHQIEMYTVCDAPGGWRGRLGWQVRHLDGRVLGEGGRRLELAADQVVLHEIVPLQRLVDVHGREQLYVRAWLEDQQGVLVSERSVLLCEPQQLTLRQEPIIHRVQVAAHGQVGIELRSEAYQHAVWLDLDGVVSRFSDNGFDLHPGMTRRITVEQAIDSDQVEQRLRVSSLLDTYR